MQPNATRPEIAVRARRLLRYEADIAFRRRACTVLEYIDPQPGDRILEDGCGLGFYLHLLGRLCDAEVWGIELDRGRLSAALDDEYASKARLAMGDVTRLPVADAGFDKLIISEVLEHLDDDATAVREIARVLKPGGVCAVTVPHAGYPPLWDPLNYGREHLGLGHFTSEPLSGIWTDHRRLYTRLQLVSLMEGAGLQVTDVRLETRYSIPFSHNLVYGLGKFVMQKNLAGRGDGGKASRFAMWTEERNLTPARVAASVITAFDRFNRESYESGAAVSLCLRAVKPV
ncbi:MAG TPA: methyltransferase domain-containing protein [Dehalococcoidia bacterium]|jgi:SAM-dependent methyltransferase